MANNFQDFIDFQKFIPLNDEDLLDADTGLLVKKSILMDKIAQKSSIPSSQSAFRVNDMVDVVVGVDDQKIDLRLFTKDGQIRPKKGFLIEVYASGSDGTLTKMFREDMVDEITDEITETGFENYLRLEVDK